MSNNLSSLISQSEIRSCNSGLYTYGIAYSILLVCNLYNDMQYEQTDSLQCYTEKAKIFSEMFACNYQKDKVGQTLPRNQSDYRATMLKLVS